MNIDTVKTELIDWIAGIHDRQTIKKLRMMKKAMNAPEQQYGNFWLRQTPDRVYS
jgi:hypothetical protein